MKKAATSRIRSLRVSWDRRRLRSLRLAPKGARGAKPGLFALVWFLVVVALSHFAGLRTDELLRVIHLLF